jgi:hypothetical protein
MDSPLLDTYRKEIRAVESRIEELFADGQSQGQFRSDIPPPRLFAAMAGFSNAIVHSWLEEDDELDIETALEHAVELFFHGVSPRNGSE